jgi:hypothetical protein
VLRLHASAQRLGLLRVALGRLLVTTARVALRNDPARLWQHVTERLAGRPKDAFARTATALVLIPAAGGRVDDEPLAAVLAAAGAGPGQARHRHRRRSRLASARRARRPKTCYGVGVAP